MIPSIISVYGRGGVNWLRRLTILFVSEADPTWALDKNEVDRHRGILTQPCNGAWDLKSIDDLFCLSRTHHANPPMWSLAVASDPYISLFFFINLTIFCSINVGSSWSSKTVWISFWYGRLLYPMKKNFQ